MKPILTIEQINKIMEGAATQVVEAIADEAQEYITREEPHDGISEAVDCVWMDLVDYAGPVTDWPINPGADVLCDLAAVLDYCEREGCIDDDSGLWEGLTGAAVLGTMAFFSLGGVLWQKLRDRGEIE